MKQFSYRRDRKTKVNQGKIQVHQRSEWFERTEYTETRNQLMSIPTTKINVETFGL